jgi:thiol-disulfide isomerase/thioredoxin
MPIRFSAAIPAIAAIAVPAIVCNVARAEDITVGSPAPKIAVASWVKGKPVKLEKGKVYVVEFWATWCGPCRVSIPHLTELAHKYKDKVTFVGVSVFERGDNIPTMVKDFVTKMGDKMDYNVALDESAGTMGKTWMEAAKQDGIPTAFIIDKQGQVAWIGHPMDEAFPKVIDQVYAGTYDVKAEADRAKAEADRKAKAEAAMAEIQPIAKKAQELAQQGKFAEAVTELDKIKSDNPDVQNGVAQMKAGLLAQQGKSSEAIAELDKIKTDNPQVQAGVAQMKFRMLVKSDGAAASAFAKELGAGLFKDNAMALNNIAWALVDPAETVKGADYDVALSLSEKSVALTKEKDATFLDTLATVYWRKGNLDKAIAIQEKAVTLINAATDAPEEMKKELNDRLAMFKKQKAGN